MCTSHQRDASGREPALRGRASRVAFWPRPSSCDPSRPGRDVLSCRLAGPPGDPALGHEVDEVLADRRGDHRHLSSGRDQSGRPARCHGPSADHERRAARQVQQQRIAGGGAEPSELQRRSCGSRPDHPGSHGGPGLVVDEQEGPGGPDLVVGVERDRLGQADPDLADVVEAETVDSRMRLEGVDVESAVDALDQRADGARTGLEQQPLPGNEGLLGEHRDRRSDVTDDVRRRLRRGEQVAAGDVDVVGQAQRDRLAGLCPGQRPVVGVDRDHRRACPAGGDHHRVAD